MVFPFVVGMNHEVRTRRQLCWLLPHEAMWEREATCWQGSGRRRMTIGNMAETGLRRNGGPGFHVGLAGMLVTNCLFQKSHCLFFPCLFLLRCGTPQVSLCTWSMGHYATNMWVSLGSERQFFKMKNAWCGSISSRFSERCQALWFLPLSVVGRIPGAGGTLVTANEWDQV